MKAIRIHKTGGPEVLTVEEIPDPVVGPKDVLVEITASGLNFIDVYFREGIYPIPLPTTLGFEGAGVVVAIGKEVKDFKVNDFVAYVGILGSYAKRSIVPESRLVKVPKKIPLKKAAAMMVQGITAQYLTMSTFPLKKGDVCLVHAAAGGVGLLLCQIAKLLGAKVIGTVSTEEKAKLAKDAGCDHVILYSKADFVPEVKQITKGIGVNVVYDGVGKATFEKSLDCLKPRGMMVLFGQASGVVPPMDLGILNRKGSLFVTRPGMNSYIETTQELRARAGQVFDWVLKGQLNVHISREFSFEQISEAHKMLEGRKTTGKVLIIP